MRSRPARVHLILVLSIAAACGGQAGGDGGGPGGDPGGNPGGVGPTARLELEARDLTVSVDDAGSTGSGALAHAWSFGDGTTAAGRTPPPHAYATAGTYRVTLTVTDGTGATGQATREVTVTQRAPGDYPPGPSTTGVPAVVQDRLYLLDLELPGKGTSLTPTAADETLLVTRSGGDHVLKWKGAALTLPPENAYREGGRLVLDRLHLRGYLDVRAPDVTLRRSLVEGVRIPDAPAVAAPTGVNTGRRLVRGNDGATTGLLLEDVSLRVPAAAQRGDGVNASYHHGLGIEASRLVLLRAEVSGTVDGMQVWQGGGTFTDVRVERSWFHDMQFHAIDAERADGDSTHADGIQVECSLPDAGQRFGVQILGNTIDMTASPSLNAALMVTKNACATSGLLISGNFLDGTPFPINIGSGLSDRHITVYANDNRFGPNRASGDSWDRTPTTSFTAKVIAAKTNDDGGAAWENYAAGKASGYVYFSFDPPAAAGGSPPSGEANRNVMVDHTPGAEAWGTASRGTAGVGLY